MCAHFDIFGMPARPYNRLYIGGRDYFWRVAGTYSTIGKEGEENEIFSADNGLHWAVVASSNGSE